MEEIFEVLNKMVNGIIGIAVFVITLIFILLMVLIV